MNVEETVRMFNGIVSVIGFLSKEFCDLSQEHLRGVLGRSRVKSFAAHSVK